MDRLKSPLPFFEAIETLKHLKRTGWSRRNLPNSESVSDHIYQMAWWCVAHPVLQDDEKIEAILMCLVHDIGKTTAGDIMPSDNVTPERKHLEEELGLKYLSCLLRQTNPSWADRIIDLWHEYERAETRIARLVHEVDEIETMHQALIYHKRYQGDDRLKDFNKMSTLTDPWLAEQANLILAEWDTLWQSGRSSTDIIFLIGGPGAGKGTQCARIVKEFNFEHISVGDLLREEQNNPGSLFGEFIQESIRNSVVVPASLTMILLKGRIQAIQERGSGVLIDGFPRSVSQAASFEQEVSDKYVTIFLECSEDKMMERLRHRSVSSQREDDNPATMKKRLKTFYDSKNAILEHVSRNPVERIDCNGTANEVYALLEEVVRARTGSKG